MKARGATLSALFFVALLAQTPGVHVDAFRQLPSARAEGVVTRGSHPRSLLADRLVLNCSYSDHRYNITFPSPIDNVTHIKTSAYGLRNSYLFLSDLEFDDATVSTYQVMDSINSGRSVEWMKVQAYSASHVLHAYVESCANLNPSPPPQHPRSTSCSTLLPNGTYYLQGFENKSADGTDHAYYIHIDVDTPRFESAKLDLKMVNNQQRVFYTATLERTEDAADYSLRHKFPSTGLLNMLLQDGMVSVSASVKGASGGMTAWTDLVKIKSPMMPSK